MSSNPNNEINEQNKAVKLEFKPGFSFHANGTKYTVSDSFTIGRFVMVNMIEEELSMLSSMGSCHQVMTEAINELNNLNPIKAGALLMNKVESDRKNVEYIPFVIRTCAAYINYDGEDLKTLTEEQIHKKFVDWSEEGLDVMPFFVFAMSMYREHLEGLKKDMLSTLKEIGTLKEALKMDLKQEA